MILTEKVKNALPRLVPILQRLPLEQYAEVDTDGGLAFQCTTQEKVKALRACFPGVRWSKQYHEQTAWWEYRGTYGGIALSIYACREAPPTCVAIEESYTVTEQIPTAYETREVTKVRLRWNCDGTEQ